MEEKEPGTPSNSDLQFEKAVASDGADSSQTCGSCSKPFESVYFEANGQAICKHCKNELALSLTGGNKIGRALKALAFGIPAAALGAGIYYGISALTGYEFGLVAIVIGLMVGGAVRVGSSRKGGWFYQTMAMTLTYLAIVATYVPYIVQGFAEQLDQETAAVAMAEADGEAQQLIIPTPGSELEGGEGATMAAATAPAEAEFPPGEVPSAGEFLFVYAFLLVVAITVPFLAGFENFMGLIIIGIGLYEAWKLNKRTVVEIKGPYQIGTASAETA